MKKSIIAKYSYSFRRLKILQEIFYGRIKQHSKSKKKPKNIPHQMTEIKNTQM